MRRGTLTALVLAATLAGCGAKPASPEEQVRQTLVRYGQASAQKDYQTICDQLITPGLAKGPEEVGLPCELAFKQGLGSVRAPTLKVLGVKVAGEKATARVITGAQGQPPSNDIVRLERVNGEWRIAALG